MVRSDTPAVAVVGMSCRAPGAATHTDFWSLLLRGGVSCGPWPGPRRCLSGVWAAGTVDDRLRERLPDLMAGGYLDDVAAFDADLFGISTREAVAMDPQHRLLLESTWAALQDAAIDPRSLARSATGVYVGLSSVDYGLLAYEGSVQAGPYGALGGSRSLGANRISHALGLAGPSISVDAACASSLVCIHLAARALASGDCDLAIAGGANLILSPSVNVNFSRARMLSSDGRCHPFQTHASGYARSEGVGTVVLKRLDEARRDGDPIRAIVAGSAVNQDGRTPGITVPSEAAQIEVIRRAWADAAITADAPDVIEGHGTGTPVGDPIELRALATLLASRDPALPPCLVGSLKANIGHTEAAAGVFSFIKAVRVLETGHVPPLVADGNLLRVPDEAEGRLTFPRDRTELPRRDAACAGVSAFGFGGTNCHVVLHAAPSPPPRAGTTTSGAVLVTLSAATREALDRMSEAWARRVEHMSASDLADAAHTSNVAYAGEAQRLWIVADTPAEAAALLDTRRSSATPARAQDALAGFGALWAAGAAVAFEPLAAPGSRRTGGMPVYPFERRRFWLSHAPCPGEPREDAAPDAASDRCSIDVAFAALPYLRDHRIDRTVVAPGATLVDLALTHACARFGDAPYVVENVVFHAPVVLDDTLNGRMRLRFARTPSPPDAAEERIAFEFWRPGANGHRQDYLVASGVLSSGREGTA